MSLVTLIAILSVAIFLPIMIRMRITQDARDEQDNRDKDYHVIKGNVYSLDTQKTYRIPKDPDEYARMFVPKDHK